MFLLTAERDYNPIIEIVTFLSGEVKKLVVIKIIDDANVEFDENFILDLTSGEGVHLSPFSRAEVVIKNDDGKNTLSFYVVNIQQEHAQEQRVGRIYIKG